MFPPRSVPLWLACTLLGCGAGDYVSGDEPPPTQPFVQVDPNVNQCPVFRRSLVIPFDIAPTQQAAVIVQATDPDSYAANLAYDWRATSGRFSKVDEPVTFYECEGFGAQVLTVRARDQNGCSGRLEIDVNCMQP